MVQVQIVYWRDIPAQIIAKIDRRNVIKKILDERFEKSIDMAAMRSGAADTDSYLQDWRRENIDDGNITELHKDILEEKLEEMKKNIEKKYDNTFLKKLIDNGGYHP